ncbi:MAG TPA: ABC transporter ATP-binding protein [Candidatus Saccharimonadales bacterium]|nr:ABC transporter ATP-binding protein [Candidatus Saccharimonadales bacterium]
MEKKSSANLINVKNLKKEYVTGEVVTPVLKDISFKIDKGEFVAIMGPSGSGKSTLMHILSFLERGTSGTYHFKGQDINEFNDNYLAELRNKEIGFVFQSFNLLPRTTVLDNVKLPLTYSKLKNHDQLAKKSLDAVGLSHRLNYYTNQISGGEKQRVAIARALVCDPAVIFADEPTGNLDSKSGNTVMFLLQQLNNQGRTIILVTHETDTANHAKRIIKIKDGQILADDPVKNRTIAEADKELIK